METIGEAARSILIAIGLMARLATGSATDFVADCPEGMAADDFMECFEAPAVEDSCIEFVLYKTDESGELYDEIAILNDGMISRITPSEIETCGLISLPSGETGRAALESLVKVVMDAGFLNLKGPCLGCMDAKPGELSYGLSLMMDKAEGYADVTKSHLTPALREALEMAFSQENGLTPEACDEMYGMPPDLGAYQEDYQSAIQITFAQSGGIAGEETRMSVDDLGWTIEESTLSGETRCGQLFLPDDFLIGRDAMLFTLGFLSGGHFFELPENQMVGPMPDAANAPVYTLAVEVTDKTHTVQFMNAAEDDVLEKFMDIIATTRAELTPEMCY